MVSENQRQRTATPSQMNGLSRLFFEQMFWNRCRGLTLRLRISDYAAVMERIMKTGCDPLRQRFGYAPNFS